MDLLTAVAWIVGGVAVFWVVGCMLEYSERREREHDVPYIYEPM